MRLLRPAADEDADSGQPRRDGELEGVRPPLDDPQESVYRPHLGRRSGALLHQPHQRRDAGEQLEPHAVERETLRSGVPQILRRKETARKPGVEEQSGLPALYP
ncbi:hypothetical protein SDC9_173224 [bioreactor metagenome]|uniref:Uncharacterized protein n=1 Tax=bioreactor metagenome TaxID=1076179 RepID=A0A645GFY4_9ZZZZ